MKQFLSAVCFACISTTVPAQRNIDVLHYKYSIELNNNNDTISGQAAITIKLLTAKPSFKLDIIALNNAGKGMKVDKITGPGFRDFIKSADSITINLLSDKTLKAGDTATFIIFYHGIPADGLIISKNKYGKRTFFSDNWPNRAHNWIPCVDDPADKATVEFIVTAPSHYQVISNGVQIEETNLPDNKKLTHWKEDVPLPTKVMVIGAADFAVNNIGEVNCVPVSSWVFPENKADGFYDYAPAKEILSWYMNYIGPYAYKKLANVQSKTMFGGMENASAIFYFENSVTGKREEEALLAHEIVHQWFGNSATEKSFAHLWLSEGFATYLTHIYLESKYGTDSLNKRMQKEREEIIEFVNTSKRPVVDSTNDYMSLLNVNSYQKGGWVLHMLRRELGDSIFKKSVRQYYTTYAGKNADTKDLQKVFEVVSGKSLEKFFKQWLYTPTNPKLDIKWKYDKNKKTLEFAVIQKQDGIAFSFPIEFELTFISGKKTKQQLNINSKISIFEYPVPEKIVKLQVDQNISLLFESTVFEMK
jgi:aminopeptidase N